jgi:VPDSG-CTERM motif
MMNNKTKFFLTLVIGMASLAILQPSTVCATTVSIGNTYGPYEVNPGGEFTFFSTDLSSMIANYNSAAKNQMGGSLNFQTFCVEGSEFISTNTTYNVALNDHSVLSNNYLTLGAAWLYSQFAQGSLSGYNYGANRTTTADQLQRAIWHYMGGQEGQGGYDSSNPFEVAAKNFFGSDANANATAGLNNFGVWVLNLTIGSNNYQDQLIYNPSVPDGGTTVMLLGLALVGLFAGRKLRMLKA